MAVLIVGLHFEVETDKFANYQFSCPVLEPSPCGMQLNAHVSGEIPKIDELWFNLPFSPEDRQVVYSSCDEDEIILTCHIPETV